MEAATSCAIPVAARCMLLLRGGKETADCACAESGAGPSGEEDVVTAIRAVMLDSGGVVVGVAGSKR